MNIQDEANEHLVVVDSFFFLLLVPFRKKNLVHYLFVKMVWRRKDE